MSGGFGPGFQDSNSRLYRSEYGLITAAVISYLIWRTFYAGGIDWLQVLFWAVFPDLVSFIPIGLSSQRKEWPSWGSTLYDVFHTILLWALAFGLLFALFGVVYFPLLGWLGHITADRAMGFGLRSKHVAQP